MISTGELRVEIARLRAIIKEQAEEITVFTTVIKQQREELSCLTVK